MVLLAGIIWALQPGCRSRFVAPLVLRVTPRQLVLFQGQRVDLEVQILNQTAEGISGEDGYFFSYHVYTPGGEPVSWDNRRFSLPRTAMPGDTSEMHIPVFFYLPDPGRYRVEFDLVKEGEFWGSRRGWAVPRVSLKLKPLVGTEFGERYLETNIDTGRPRLDRLQYLLRLTLINSELPGREGKLFGFSAGTHYPALWIRDLATFVDLALAHYPRDKVIPMVECFLEHQSPEGEVVDWVNPRGETGKNTVESDQESSLVIAAYRIWQRDKSWIYREIRGESILLRLTAALDWLYKHRLHREYRLLESGFTADFGDVSKDHAGQQALQLTEDTTRVVGIYTQAKYIQALDGLLEMLRHRPEGNRMAVRKWEDRRKEMILHTRQHLYLPDRGYYLIHRVPAEPDLFEVEKNMLAVGGNAEALRAGLMTVEEIRRFIVELESRREQYRLRSVGFTLVPPYPEGFFQHHLMRRPWHYQNGGEWDWIAGRLIEGLFSRGFGEPAEDYLLQIAERAMEEFNFNEWYDRSGNPRGADHYTGAAGVIYQSIDTGYRR